jgi:hypothetical protein
MKIGPPSRGPEEEAGQTSRCLQFAAVNWPKFEIYSQQSLSKIYHGDDLMHTTTSGLFAGVRARQVAERSFEYSAGFLPGPQ